MRSVAAEHADRRVVLLALDALGDLVLRQPLFTGLADHGLDVTVVVRPGYDEILPFLDRRLTAIEMEIDPHGPISADTQARLATLASAIARLQPDTLVAAAHNRTWVDEWLVHQFPECDAVGFANPLLPESVLDAVLSTPESHPSAVAALGAPARGALRTTDVAAGSRRPELFTHAVDCPVDSHETQKYRALFHAITGAHLADGPPTIALDDDARKDAVDTIRALGLEPGQYVLGCPAGTSRVALKAWPAAQYVALATHLRDRYDLPVLLVGSESESSVLHDVARAGEQRGVRMPVWTGGGGSLATLLGLIGLSRLYVGNDTGPMHLAGALGIPVVARFGGGHWPRFIPLARRAFSATQHLPCVGCGWQCWLDEAACMTLIDTETFVDGLDWVLGGTDAERRLHVGRPLDHRWSTTFLAGRDIRRRLEADLRNVTRHAAARLEQVHELTRTVHVLRQPRLRLAVNLRTLWPDRIGGLEDAFRQVMGRLLVRHRGEVEVTLFTSTINHHAFDAWDEDIRRVRLPDQGWEPALARAVRRVDVLWCPLFFLEPVAVDVPSVVTIPDLQHEAFPEFFTPDVLAYRLQQCRIAAAHADRVVTLSAYSRQQILHKYNLPDDRVSAIHLDARTEFTRPVEPDRAKATRERYGLPERYGLCPANSWPHKNHRGLFQAIARYRDRYGDPPCLVLTGATEVGGIDVPQEIAAAGVGDLVRHLGFIDRDDMPGLYDGAAFLAFVSLYEGFGIPVVEAFRRGTPVIASNTTSLPEVAGDAALLVDPRDPDAIAAAMHDVLTDTSATRARVARGRARAQRFSYDEAAEATWRVLHEVTARPSEAAAIALPRARPKVLVVTPSFNQGRFLRETIESVLSQDYDNLEYIVADGGSTDESLEILRSYGDRVQWTSGPDGGQAAAIAQAWMHTDAEIVAWLNSDDTYLEGAIATAVDYLLAHPETAMVYGDAWYTDADGQRTAPYPTKPFQREALAGECFICQPTVFLRREVLAVVAPPDAALEYCMDYDLWIRLSQHFKVDYCDRFLATSRMHAQNKTLGQRDGVYREIMAVNRRHFGAVHEAWVAGYAHYRWTREAGLARFLPTTVQARQRAKLVDRVRSEVDGLLYEDRWAGRRTVLTVESDAAGRVTLECDCPLWPYLRALTITVSADGQVLAEHDVHDADRFALTFQLSSRSRTRATVLLEASDAVIPLLHKLSPDPRALSFRILSHTTRAHTAPSSAEHLMPLAV